MHVCLPAIAPDGSRDEITVSNVDVMVGGGTAIVSLHLAALGHGVTVVPMLAEDRLGDHLLDQLVDQGVRVVSPVRDGSRTTVAVIASDRRATHHITYSPSTAAMERFADFAHVADVNPAFLYSPGFPGFEPLLEILVDHRVPVIVDLGFRPWMADVATYRREVLSRAGLANIAVLSSADLADDELVALMKEVQSAGPEIVVATIGPRGALLLTHQETLSVAGIGCTPVHTVGAGDAFVAGFVAGMAEGLTLEAAARLGNATAAMRISRFPEIAHRWAVDSLLAADSGSPTGRSLPGS